MQVELIHSEIFFFIPYFYIIVSLIFIFSIIRTLDFPDCLLKSQRFRIIEVFSFTLNVAYFSPIQIPRKGLPLLDLKLYFEGRIAQARFQ